MPAFFSRIEFRLAAVAALPAAILALSIATYSYVSSVGEIDRVLQEKGNLIASVIAKQSQFALVSGNAADAKKALAGIVQADADIGEVKIFDTVGDVVASRRGLYKPDLPEISLMIMSESLDSESLEDLSVQPSSFSEGETIGRVSVVMSRHNLAARNQAKLVLLWSVVLLLFVVSLLLGTVFTRDLRISLRRIISALRRIADNDYDFTADGIGSKISGELGEVQAVIQLMARRLAESRYELEHAVDERTKELIQVTQDRRNLIARKNAEVEDERRRIAVEIHDHLNAKVVVLNLKIQHVVSMLPSAAAADMRKPIQEVYQTLEELYKTARNIINQLRPEVIDTLGIKDAIAQMSRVFDELHSSCVFNCKFEGDISDIGGDIAINIYRLIQESLSNVVKHSHATKCDIFVCRKNAELFISVSDNGIGFDLERKTRSLGLIGLKERVEYLNGKITIEPSEKGTTVSFRIPCSLPFAMN